MSAAGRDASPAAQDATLAIEALRSAGAARWAPVRFRYVEALARRRLMRRGAARRRLDAKLAAAIEVLEQTLAAAAPQPAAAAAAAEAAAPGPLGVLVAGLASGDVSTSGELKTLRHFAPTIERLRVEQRLRQSRARVPLQAGPLNSHRLLHEALDTLRTLSPAYLRRFMAHVDALLWLDQASGASALDAAAGAATVDRPAAKGPKPTPGRAPRAAVAGPAAKGARSRRS